MKKVKQVEIKNRTFELIELVLPRHNQSQEFRIKLVKNRQKALQRH